MATQDQITPNTPVSGLGRSALIGLLTGGPVGIVLSPLVLYGIHKSGKRGKEKWAAWAICGILGVPASWVVASRLIAMQEPAAVPPAPTAIATPATSLTVGDFTYSNVSFAPYHYDGSADIAGKLIAVYADVVNGGNKSDSPGNIYTIKDEQGREFKEAAFGVGLMDDGPTANSGLLPGQKRHVRVGIFDVSPDSHTYQLGIARMFGGAEYVQGRQ